MTAPRTGRRPLRWMVMSLLLVVGGCRFLADEFTWLDRAGPVIDDARDGGDVGRP